MGVRQGLTPVRQALRIAAQPSVTRGVPRTAFHDGTHEAQDSEYFDHAERSSSADSASTSDQAPKLLGDAQAFAEKYGTAYSRSRAAFDPSSIAEGLRRLSPTLDRNLSPKFLHRALPHAGMSALFGSTFSTTANLAATLSANSNLYPPQTGEEALESAEVPSPSGPATELLELPLKGQSNLLKNFSQVRRPFKHRTKKSQVSTESVSGARQLTTEAHGSATEQGAQTTGRALPPLPPRTKVKALRKTAQHIMNILDQEAVAALKQKKNYPEFRAGDVLELDLIVPENRRRTAIVRGVCLSRRNAGVGSSFVIRRVVAGEGMEYTYPLYSPNIQSIKIIERRPVRRAKLYYLRDWNPQECTV